MLSLLSIYRSDSFHLKLYITEDEDVCLARRIKRDIAERGRTATMVIERYLKFVKPSFRKFVAPYSKNAHLIIPNAKVNDVALSVVLNYILKREGALIPNSTSPFVKCPMPPTDIEPLTLE